MEAKLFAFHFTTDIFQEKNRGREKIIFPFYITNGQNKSECHGFVITRAKKEAPATTTSALILHQLFEQILYIPLIVFSFLHQPTDTICLIPLLQKLGERPIERGLPPLDHAAILLQRIARSAYSSST